MANPTNQEDQSIESAAKWNRELAGRVTRWKRVRLSLAILLGLVGLVAALSGSASIWSVPCFVLATIAYLLYLDSRDQVREIRARRWTSITPRIRRIVSRPHKETGQTAPPH